MKAALEQIKDFQWCLAGRGCTSGQEHVSDGRNPVLRCRDCKRRTCVDCQVPFHEGETCKQYRRRKGRQGSDEQKSKRLIEGTTKACPRSGCRARIEKSEGCDHMTCTVSSFSTGFGCRWAGDLVLTGGQVHAVVTSSVSSA